MSTVVNQCTFFCDVILIGSHVTAVHVLQLAAFVLANIYCEYLYHTLFLAKNSESSPDPGTFQRPKVVLKSPKVVLNTIAFVLCALRELEITKTQMIISPSTVGALGKVNIINSTKQCVCWERTDSSQSSLMSTS